MKTVTDYGALAAQINGFFGRGNVTNCFLTKDQLERDIAAGRLYSVRADGALLLFRRRESHLQLYFYLAEGADVQGLPLPEEPFVTEIAFRERDAGLRQAAENWQRAGLKQLCLRHRMKRGNEPPRPGKIPVDFARQDQLSPILALLRGAFAADTGCLPTEEELAGDMAAGRVLAAVVDDQVAGVLHFQPGKPAFELAHLATAPAFRGRGVASALVARFCALPEARGFRVWVVTGNRVAENLYETYGFADDGFRSVVLGGGR